MRRCIQIDCDKQPNFNLPGEKIAVYCATHKLSGMIDIISKRCIQIDCDKRPNFNLPGETVGLYCVSHKLPGMIDVKNKRCIQIDCDKQPVYNLPGEKRRLYCNLHKLSGMLDVIHKMCIGNHCETRALYKLNYCSTCLQFYKPHHPRIKNVKQREIYVTKKIIEHYPDLNWVIDKAIKYDNCQVSCNNKSRRRPDLFLDAAHYSIIVEIDEDQHRNYLCESKRSMEIFQSLGNRPIVFIRFNPDTYTEDDKKYSGCFKFNSSGVIFEKGDLFKIRFKKLIETIDNHLTTTPTKEITIDPLFYNKD